MPRGKAKPKEPATAVVEPQSDGRFMMVRPIAKGYHGRLRNPEDPKTNHAFQIQRHEFSSNWMVEVPPAELSDRDKREYAREQASDQSAKLSAEAG